MPKYFSEKLFFSKKNYAHNIFRVFSKMRALWSKSLFSLFSQKSGGGFAKWTFLKCPKSIFGHPVWPKNLHFLNS
jgi:hypothetical protein